MKAKAVGFRQLLAILFIALKLLGRVSWPWLWVLSPVWVPPALFVLIYAALGLIVVVKHYLQAWAR